MRVLTLILFLLFNGVALFALPGGAFYSEEITADWESGSEAVLQGERVLSDLINRNAKGLKVNAFCSTESIQKLEVLRTIAVDIIISSEKTGSSYSEKKLAGDILKRIGDVSFKSLSRDEQNLVIISEETIFSGFCLQNKNFTDGNLPAPEYAAVQLIISLTITASLKLKNNKDKIIHKILSDKDIICSKNLFDREFADLYRLFLYVKDNSGNRKKRSAINKLFLLCFCQSLYNSTRYINTTNTYNPINTSGVLL